MDTINKDELLKLKALVYPTADKSNFVARNYLLEKIDIILSGSQIPLDSANMEIYEKLKKGDLE